MGYFQVPQISQIYTVFFLCLSIIKKRFNSKPMELNLFFYTLIPQHFDLTLFISS